MSFYSNYGTLVDFKEKKVFLLTASEEYDSRVIELFSNDSPVYVKVPSGWNGRPDLVSNAVWGSPNLWPEILTANSLHDPFELKGGMIIKIPQG
jgi:hypothetical protein